MEQLFIADIKRIKEASLNGKLVIFVGAGISANSGIPNWNTLIENLQKELPKSIAETENDKLKIAQLYKNYREQKEYIEKIRKELKDGIASFNPIHEIIFKLNPSHVVTTNYDDLLEQVVLQNNLQYFKIDKDKDIPYATYNKFIIKMHGDLQVGNIVLTEDDYLNYDINFPLIETYIKSLFASKLVLFVGFSFDDYNLKVITNKVKYLLGDDFQTMYLLNTGKTDFLRREYYKKRGVKVIDYHELIDKELIGTYSKKELEDLKKLSHPKGKELYKFIHYILKFNAFEEEHKDEHIIDLLFNSIQYFFNELRVIGGKEILNFYPFDKEKGVSYFYFVLRTNNKAIYELRDSLRGNTNSKREFLKKYGEKYRKIVWFARLNGIEWIDKQTKEAENGTSFKLPVIGRKKHKSGLDYLYELNFKELFKYIVELKSYSSDDISNKDLELPFLLYKVGNYYESYIKFREIAQKCWVGEKYILYFICQINLKNIAHLLWNENFHTNRKLDFEIIQSIKEESEQIDLEDILARIQTKSKVLHRLIQKVNDFRYVYEIINSINKLTDKINESNRIARGRGFSSNSDVEQLLDSTWQLWNFTNNNFIASEHFSDHLFVYKKAFEGFIISNSIPENEDDFWHQTSKLKELHPFHIIIVLFRVEFKYLEGLFSTHNIRKLEFNKGSLDFIYKMAINATESFSVPSRDDRLLTNSISGAFQNLLLILSKIKLKEELSSQVVKKIIENKSIELESIERALQYFINSPHNTFTSVLLNELLIECFLRNNIRRIPTDLIFNLLNKINPENTNYSITHERILDRLSQPEFIEDYQLRYLLMKLYHILPKSNQKEIFKRVNNTLTKKFDIEIFRVAYDHKLPIKKEFTNQFVSEIESYFKGKSRSSHEKLNLLVLYSIFNQSKDSDIINRIEKLSKKVPFLDFLIHTKEFSDYSTFDVEWLCYLSEKHYQIISEKTIIKTQIQEKLKDHPQPKWLLDIYIKYFSK